MSSFCVLFELSHYFFSLVTKRELSREKYNIGQAREMEGEGGRESFASNCLETGEIFTASHNVLLTRHGWVFLVIKTCFPLIFSCQLNKDTNGFNYHWEIVTVSR